MGGGVLAALWLVLLCASDFGCVARVDNIVFLCSPRIRWRLTEAELVVDDEGEGLGD